MLDLAVSLQFYCSQHNLLLNITFTQQCVCVCVYVCVSIDVLQKIVETNYTENENSQQSSV